VGYICVVGALPAPVTGLGFGGNNARLMWDKAPAAIGYDLVKGDLAALASSGGDFSAAIIDCLVDGGLPSQANDRATPAAGNAFFYLVRSIGPCALPGSYDSGGPAQAGPRDAGIDAAALACP
jgi:hypothetical protein